MRIAEVKRQSLETEIDIRLNLDGQGQGQIETGLGFLDHMLQAFCRHGLFDLEVKAKGDLWVDAHHLIEDTGMVLGQALHQALGQRRSIRRFGDAIIPMDESLVAVSLDLSGRPYLVWAGAWPTDKPGGVEPNLWPEFMKAFTWKGGLNLHIDLVRGSNGHHAVEAAFKGLARALRVAVEIDPRVIGVPSTKGGLDT